MEPWIFGVIVNRWMESFFGMTVHFVKTDFIIQKTVVGFSTVVMGAVLSLMDACDLYFELL